MDYLTWTFANGGYDQDKPLYIDPTDPKRCLSARQIKTLVRQLSSGLPSHGLKQGDCVCVVGFNDIYYTPLYLGIMAAGGIFTGANPGYTTYELAHHLQICDAKFVVSDLTSLEKAMTAAEQSGIPRCKVFVFDVHGEQIPEGYRSWRQLLQHGEADFVTVVDPEKTTACYINTSGTSGLPKAATLPHSYLVSQAMLQVDRKLPYEVSRLICLPPFPGYVATVQHGAPIREGRTIYIMSRYDPEVFVEAIGRFQITETLLVPPMLLSLPLSVHCQSHALRSLRQVFVGGASIGNHVQQCMYKVLSEDARVNQIYGMTEAGWVCGSQYPEKDETGSIGRPLKGFKLKLLDEHGQVVDKDGKTGELLIKPPFPMLGYRLNPQTTADTFTADGYIRSGDIGAFNNGKWYICDRKKDIIKVRGWQVSPTEIEAALLEHPDIIDAAVIGLPAEDGLSEVPRAYVVRSPTSGIGEDAVKLFLKARLARYKEVGRVIFVASVPRNPTGKILRRLLREAEGHDQKPADGVGLNQDRPALCEVLQDALEKLSSSPKVH